MEGVRTWNLSGCWERWYAQDMPLEEELASRPCSGRYRSMHVESEDEDEDSRLHRRPRQGLSFSDSLFRRDCFPAFEMAFEGALAFVFNRIEDRNFEPVWEAIGEVESRVEGLFDHVLRVA